MITNFDIANAMTVKIDVLPPKKNFVASRMPKMNKKDLKHHLSAWHRQKI